MIINKARSLLRFNILLNTIQFSYIHKQHAIISIYTDSYTFLFQYSYHNRVKYIYNINLLLKWSKGQLPSGPHPKHTTNRMWSNEHC